MMSKRGCLRSKDGSTFLLAPKVTTVGREGCDLVAPVVGVDYQHAVIEYSEQEDCFVLQDLNTQQGTFVNECRVQNAAVRLAPGDEIRFGNNNNAFRFEIETQTQNDGQPQAPLTYPPVQQRAAWTQPLTVLSGVVSPPAFINSESLPHLQSVVKSTTSTWGGNQSPGYQVHGQVPRPPQQVKGRPMSAGGNVPPTYVGRRASPDVNGSMISPIPQGGITHRAVQGGGWVSMGPLNTRTTGVPQQGMGVMNETGELTSVQDKEQRLIRLSEEVRRLALFETECSRKDEHILSLREEIAELQRQLRQIEISRQNNICSSDAELTQKLLQLENDVSIKKTEIISLRDQINKMKLNDSRGNGSPGMSRQEMNDRVSELNSLKQELERVKKDKNITSGLVTSMQRDMSSKDTTISRLTREIENIKKEIGEKNIQLVSMQSKFKKVDDNRKFDEEIDAKEKELTVLKIKKKKVPTATLR